MRTNADLTTLVPPGFTLSDIVGDADCLELVLRPARRSCPCPDCRASSESIHSRYVRKLSDLPASGRCVRLLVEARHFRCRASSCARRIFTERFDLTEPWSRRTARLNVLVYHLALALGGHPASRFADRLMAPVSKDTLLRQLRRRGRPGFAPPRVIGIDDWAWRRNQRYGTIVCDLERRRPIRLLKDREASTAQDWLEGQPQIEIIARDRGGGYALAAAKALPGATQVADRWHLMENASSAFLDAVRRSMRDIRSAIGAAAINPALLTAAERIQYEGYLRREETNAAIKAHAADGLSIKEIVRRTGHSRKLVRSILRGERTDVFRCRENSLEPFLGWLDDQWAAGDRNGARLWRRLKAQGFRGSLRVTTEWATRRRRAEKAEKLHRTPAARTIARMMTTGRDRLTKAETVTIAIIEKALPVLVSTRELIDDFHAIVRKRASAVLDQWLGAARESLVYSFANGLSKDIDAVRAAIELPWSNGQTEGQITKLKLVKRQMYGRGKLDLLEARLIGAT
jgi:transposase